MDFNLFTVHPKIALLLSHTEFLFVLNTLVGNKDARGELHKHYAKNNEAGQNLEQFIKTVIVESKVLEACQRMMEFKTVNGRGLPWSLNPRSSEPFRMRLSSSSLSLLVYRAEVSLSAAVSPVP